MQVILLISVQFCLLGAMQIIQITYDNGNEILNAGLIYLIILVSLLALVSIIRLLVRTREQAAKTTQEVYIEDIMICSRRFGVRGTIFLIMSK